MVNQFTGYFDKDKLYQEEFLRTLTRINIESLAAHEFAFNNFLKNKFTKPNELEVTLFTNNIVTIASELIESNKRLDQLYELHGLKTVYSGTVKNYIQGSRTPEWEQKLNYEKLIKERELKNESRANQQIKNISKE